MLHLEGIYDKVVCATDILFSDGSSVSIPNDGTHSSHFGDSKLVVTDHGNSATVLIAGAFRDGWRNAAATLPPQEVDLDQFIGSIPDSRQDPFHQLDPLFNDCNLENFPRNARLHIKGIE